jgi:hypothetical protein
MKTIVDRELKDVFAGVEGKVLRLVQGRRQNEDQSGCGEGDVRSV